MCGKYKKKHFNSSFVMWLSGVSPGEVNVRLHSDRAEDQSDSTNGLGRSG